MSSLRIKLILPKPKKQKTQSETEQLTTQILKVLHSIMFEKKDQAPENLCHGISKILGYLIKNRWPQNAIRLLKTIEQKQSKEAWITAIA